MKKNLDLKRFCKKKLAYILKYKEEKKNTNYKEKLKVNYKKKVSIQNFSA